MSHAREQAGRERAKQIRVALFDAGRYEGSPNSNALSENDMSLSSACPVTVVMKKRPSQSRWQEGVWGVEDVLAGWVMPVWADANNYKVQGLELQLFDEQSEGYLENWAAPDPKVYVAWRMQDEHAMPVSASVSFAAGTDMLDSKHPTQSVPMPRVIHDWLGHWLQVHRPAAARPARGWRGM